MDLDPEQAALRYRIFDDRDADEVVFSDRFLTTRKQHRCVICREHIPPTSRCRATTGLDRSEGNSPLTLYSCPSCCAAMAAAISDPNDAGRAIEARTAIGMEWVRSRR